MTAMDTFPQTVRVATSRARDHVENIRIRDGESIVVGHRNQQYPEFLWCAAEDGHAGWVPEQFLHMDTDKEATALRDYDAAQLTVVKGETLEARSASACGSAAATPRAPRAGCPRSCLEAVES